MKCPSKDRQTDGWMDGQIMVKLIVSVGGNAWLGFGFWIVICTTLVVVTIFNTLLNFS